MSDHPSTQLDGHPKSPLPIAPIEVIPPADPCSIPKSITIRWAVSRTALARRAPTGENPLLHLECRLSPPQAPVWTIIDPTTNTHRLVELETPDQAPAVNCTEHSIELESPTLRAHLVRNELNDSAPLYVRTDIFRTLDIAGGRYTPINASVEYPQ